MPSSFWAYCFIGAVALGCEKVPERAVEQRARAVVPSRAVPAHQPRSRPWRLHPGSPFKLVAEGLRDLADLRQIAGAMVVVGEPCSAPPGRKTAPPSEVRIAAGDSFDPQALPALVLPEGKLRSAAILDGRWPNDLWLQLGYDSDESEYIGGALLAKWNGRAWQFVGRENNRDIPQHLLDWYDGARLVVSYQSLKPFRVLGKTTHPPPDFSLLPFDPPRRERDMRSIEYAGLSTYELFVAVWSRGNRIGIGRATSSGAVALETVDVAPAEAGPVRFVVGKLNGKEQAIAWSELRQGRGRLWVRSYDRLGFSQLPSPPPFGEVGYTDLWLSAGLLWARQVSTIWRYDRNAWLKHATVSAEAQLTPTTDGGIWVKERDTIRRLDLQGNSRAVPFLEESATNASLVYPVRLVAGATPDDVWLHAQEGDEALLFRTRAMTNMLWCD